MRADHADLPSLAVAERIVGAGDPLRDGRGSVARVRPWVRGIRFLTAVTRLEAMVRGRNSVPMRRPHRLVMPTLAPAGSVSLYRGQCHPV